MSSNGRYMECLLGIDTKSGWEKSVTKVLSSFQDLSFHIDASSGLAYVKGKIDPHTVLKKLKKGGNHTMIHWVTYGPERDYHSNQPYVPVPKSGHGHDPYYYANDVYDPYSFGNWRNSTDYHLLAQNPHRDGHYHLHHVPSSHREQIRSSGHLHHHDSPARSSSSSRPVIEPLVKQPTSVGFIVKKAIGKLFN